MALCATLALPAPVAAAPQVDLTESESLVTSRADLIDPEYRQASARITWVDHKGGLWVAGIDRNTGLFRPADGRGVLVDPDAMATADIKTVGNGPEWLSTDAGEQIVYTKYVAGQPHTLANARLAIAARDASGAWQHQTLGDLPRFGPLSSIDPGDKAPRIVYVDPNGNQYWREIKNPASETIVPWVQGWRYTAMRIVRGARAILFVAPVDGVSQVFRYWQDSQLVEQLTFDGDHDSPESLYMWRAPEFDNDFVFMILAKGATELRIYRQTDKAKPQWSVICRASVTGGATMTSAEPFVHNGKSYVFAAVKLPGQALSSAVYLSNIDAASPMFRRLTPQAPLRVREDPEVFITNQGPYIYYVRRVLGDPPCPCSEGIYRTATGLGPP